MKKSILIFILLGCILTVKATDTIPQKRGIITTLYKFVKEFSRVDTNYVEPQKYNFAAMIQNTNTYEVYRVSNREGMSFIFSPKPRVKIGPYFGWRWIFLGYTLDVSHIKDSNQNLDLDLSFYSNQIGVDIFYRKSGDNYKIREADLGKNIKTDQLKGIPFDGISASIKGLNLYYIFNHRKFSYPAAYSQSTIQRRSAGSFLAGIGYTRHTLDMDWNRLNTIIKEHTGHSITEDENMADQLISNVEYTDFSVSGGYAYNWVFARNWLFDASLSLALSYKTTKGDNKGVADLFKKFSLDNFNIDGIGRFGIVWNNSRWFAGANTIFHSYNYRKSQFSTNNTFGSINIYVGFNFNKR